MKCKGKIRFSKSLLAKLLKLPESVDIAHIDLDQERDIASFVLTSDEPIENLTFPTQVGQSARISSHLTDLEG